MKKTEWKQAELEEAAKEIKKLTAMHLEEKQIFLIQSRLSPLLEREKIKDLQELFVKVKVDPLIRERVVHAITTHESFFFRDLECMNLFKSKLIPDYLDKIEEKKNPSPLKILSAGCSNGQEAYSLLMLLEEHFPDLFESPFMLLAFDISETVLEKARKGIYSERELSRGVSPSLKAKYFRPEGKDWKVKERIRSRVSFSRHNLMEPLNLFGKFDIIFCRYLLSYIAPEYKKLIFKNLSSALQKNGALVLAPTDYLEIENERIKLESQHQYPYYLAKG